MNTPTTTADTLFDYNRWQATLAADAQRYQQNQPYPHIALENFLEPWAAERALASFPAVGDAGWIHYVHVNEKKHGLNKMELLPAAVQDVIRE